MNSGAVKHTVTEYRIAICPNKLCWHHTLVMVTFEAECSPLDVRVECGPCRNE